MFREKNEAKIVEILLSIRFDFFSVAYQTRLKKIISSERVQLKIYIRADERS